MSAPILMEFYLNLLQTAGFEVNDDFFVMHKPTAGKKAEHVKVLEKNLVLPFPGHLKRPDTENNIFFHPLCEQIIRNESEVFMYLKRAMTMRMILSMSSLGAALVRIHTDVNLQKSLSIKQIEFIKGLADCDDKTIAGWTGFIWGNISANPNDSTKWPLRMYIRQNGRYQGKNYQRVCSVAFPLIEQLISGQEPDKPGSEGQKYRAKDYRAFKQIALAIFPEITTEIDETYNSGYGDTFAANLMSFLLSYQKLANRINSIVEIMREPLERAGAQASSIELPIAWVDQITTSGLEDLAKANRTIPALAGNMGVPVDGRVKEQVEKDKDEPAVTRRPVAEPAKDDRRTELAKRWQAEEEASRSTKGPLPWEDDEKPEAPKLSTAGKISFGDVIRRNPNVEKSTRAYEEYEEERRPRRSWRDDRDDRYRDRDDRGYRDRGSRSLYPDDRRDYRGSRYDRDDRYGGRDRDVRDDRYDCGDRYAPARRSLYGDPPAERRYR